MRKLEFAEDALIAEVPPKALLCKVYLPNETKATYLSPDKLGRILQAIPDADAGDGLTGWHDFLDSHGVASKYTSTRQQTVLTFPQMSRTIPYTPKEGGKPEDVTVLYPPCTFYFVWDNGKMTQSFVYTSATRPRTMSDGVPLRRFPWGNADEDGRICWGCMNVSHLTHKDPMGVVNIFFSTIFNQHIWGVILQDERGRQIMLNTWALAHPDTPLPMGTGHGAPLGDRVRRIADRD